MCFALYTGTCKLGEWSEWTSCDCVVGARKRVREVFVPPGVSPVNCHAHRVENKYDCDEQCRGIACLAIKDAMQSFCVLFVLLVSLCRICDFVGRLGHWVCKLSRLGPDSHVFV